ncbi:hypothetical protein LNQ49_18065 [Flavobacterium sp. F-65]|uniref:Uncharacterized protein n=1 Tax=Flavobacterium pisciphilum TaxID=2893755 RepID=A0ABS8N074_9FLAO|nr:hypothetical protein [Flavobacterium sp. F-65]MCC9073485.1 hypothetical protein [Flavobacterium sp. F-65]
MQTIKSIVVALMLLIVGATTTTAQQNKNTSKGPHNGLLQNAGEYSVEMIERDSSCSFYILNSKGKIISNKGVTGEVTFEFFNKTKANNSISSDINNSLFVNIPKANIYTYCTLTAVVKGKTITAKFKNTQVSQQDINHGHQH